MNKRIVASALMTLAVSAVAQDDLQYKAGNVLPMPDYQTWPMIGVSLGLSYIEPEATEETSPDNYSIIFVDPAAYDYFMETGTWKDETMFIGEFRRAETEFSIQARGTYASERFFVEALVKDDRFPKGWEFYAFSEDGEPLAEAAPMTEEQSAVCHQCHIEHAAVEHAFVQFYPNLLPVAREKGTLKYPLEAGERD